MFEAHWIRVDDESVGVVGVFIPYVTVQVIDGHVMMDSTSAEAAAHTGTAMIDAMTKQLKKRGF